MADDYRRSVGPPKWRTSPPAPRASTTPPGMALPTEVGYAMQSLSRASRSFSLYDPHNDAVKQLIADYKEKMAAVIRNAPVEVEVLPFEMTYGGEVVYQEADRERSLAFRLFRDGVRKIRFDEGTTWDDLVTLLEVLSVRCNSVRQQEEDLVTLLHKARFAGIVIESVEGYVPEEERPEQVGLAAATADTDGDTYDPPQDWDQPLPQVPAPCAVSYQPVSEAALARLREEESPDGLAQSAVRAVTEVLQAAYGLRDVKFRDDVMSFLDEVQEYLLVERNLDALSKLAVTYEKIHGPGQALPALQEERAFDRLLRSVSEREEPVPDALWPLLACVPGDHVSRALSMLELDPRGARRAALLEIVERGSAADASMLLEQLPRSRPDLAHDLFDILARVAPDRRIEAAFDLLAHPDEGFQLELVDVIASGARGIRMARALQTFMASAHEPVRIKAVESFGALGGARAVPVIAEHARRTAASELSSAEANAIGTAMALASVDDAKPILLEWANAGGGIRNLIARLTKDRVGDRMLTYAAVAGLELCPGQECDAAIEAVLSRATGDLRWRCQEALDRRGGRSGDG